MTLTEWIDTRVKDGPRQTIYETLSEAAGVSVQTIANVDRGMRLNTYSRAKALSDATKGAVTVAELCE